MKIKLMMIIVWCQDCRICLVNTLYASITWLLPQDAKIRLLYLSSCISVICVNLHHVCQYRFTYQNTASLSQAGASSILNAYNTCVWGRLFYYNLAVRLSKWNQQKSTKNSRQVPHIHHHSFDFPSDVKGNYLDCPFWGYVLKFTDNKLSS